MELMKSITVLILSVGLMSLLGLIVVDEFMMAAQFGGELDPNIIELLQMSITGIVGIVAGFLASGSKSKGCGNPDCKCGQEIYMFERVKNFFKERGEGTAWDLDYGKLIIIALCIYIAVNV